MKSKQYSFIISGGGTGGHIFPAISIANALKEKYPESKFLFVGAEGRMEMTRVPKEGYQIEGLPVRGFNRKNLLKNISVVLDLLRSIRKARKIIKKFRPDIAIGVGGYASAPTLRAASYAGVPTLLQEQNSYAGVTNKLLAKQASKICVAYQNMERFFPKDKIILTGNPVRQDLLAVSAKDENAYQFFDFSTNKKTLLIVGGSLGARTINDSVIAHLKELTEADIQIIWQTGKLYIKEAKKVAEVFESKNLIVTDFVSRMDYAYSIADLVVSRAGASSISELCLLKKPVILVPSPNVAEDHQTQNALALVENEAALMVKDAEAKDLLISQALELISNEKEMEKLSKNIGKLAEKDSANRIAEEVMKIVSQNTKKR